MLSIHWKHSQRRVKVHRFLFYSFNLHEKRRYFEHFYSFLWVYCYKNFILNTQFVKSSWLNTVQKWKINFLTLSLCNGHGPRPNIIKLIRVHGLTSRLNFSGLVHYDRLPTRFYYCCKIFLSLIDVPISDSFEWLFEGFLEYNTVELFLLYRVFPIKFIVLKAHNLRIIC